MKSTNFFVPKMLTNRITFLRLFYFPVSKNKNFKKKSKTNMQHPVSDDVM